jgi:Na+(H+)/acetate symporter ActP
MSQDLSGIMNGVMWTQVVLAMLFVGARLYTRYFIIRNVGWDDIFMLVNLVRTLVSSISFPSRWSALMTLRSHSSVS